MAELNRITIGDDVRLTIAIKDDTGTPLDLSGLDGFALFVFQSKERIIQQYSINPVPDFNSDDIEIVDAVNGTFVIRLQSSVTIKAEPGTLFGEFMVQVTDTEFDDDSFLSRTPGICLAEIVDGVSETVGDIDP